MKHLTSIIVLLCLCISPLLSQNETLPAQRNLSERLQATAQALQLDEAQAAKLQTVYLRESAQLQEITSLKTSDPQKYTQKLQAIRKGTMGSIRLLLRDEQIPLYNQLAAQWRLQEHQLRQKMKGSPEMDIQEALMRQF